MIDFLTNLFSGKSSPVTFKPQSKALAEYRKRRNKKNKAAKQARKRQRGK